MSLLEVLISIFVLSIGLLGVAALIPVAGHEILQAVKADRAAACGEAVLEDMKIRRMLRPASWRGVTGASILRDRPSLVNPPLYAPRQGFEFGESFAIDPVYIAKNQSPAANRNQFSDFPYNPLTPGLPVLPPGDWAPTSNWYPRTWTRMHRVTWSGVGLGQALAELVFMWHDDLVVAMPADDTERPGHLMIVDNTPARNPLVGENAGNYTYMVTVTPSAENIDFAALGRAWTLPENAPLYTVSVVVFYKRDMAPPGPATDDPPGERQARLEFLDQFGLGGGDVLLTALPGQPAEYLDIKENEWLMVSGGYVRQAQYDDINGFNTVGVVPVGVHKWYRILATGETVVEGDNNRNGRFDPRDPEDDPNGNGALDPPYREVTLAGPDWNVALTNVDWDNDGQTDVYATLLKGAVGVYTKTVEFDW